MSRFEETLTPCLAKISKSNNFNFYYENTSLRVIVIYTVCAPSVPRFLYTKMRTLDRGLHYISHYIVWVIVSGFRLRLL